MINNGFCLISSLSFKTRPIMASLNSLSLLTKPITKSQNPNLSTKLFVKSNPPKNPSFLTRKRRNWVIGSVTEDKEVVPVIKDKKNVILLNGCQDFESLSDSTSSVSGEEKEGGGDDDDKERLSSKAINAAIVLGFGTVAVTRLLTIDHDYWHGWTLFEVLRFVPEHNWIAYEEALKTNPVLAKMAISGIVYSLGDWIAQCYEGKPLFEFDRTRMFRSGLVGFTFHGSLSHYYYQICEALFPFQDWWVVPAKVAFDQTVWAAVWNSIYFVVLGLLRFESPANIFSELKATFWPLLTLFGLYTKRAWLVSLREYNMDKTIFHSIMYAEVPSDVVLEAGWKLWPFAHLITYGVIPIEQRLLWVDCVELIWVTILSTYSNEKSEVRISEAMLEADSNSSSSRTPEE